MSDWLDKNVASDFKDLRNHAMRILQEEAELDEIVKLVGVDALSDKDRLTLETAKMLREDYLHQNAFHDIDTYSSLTKQHMMLEVMIDFYEEGNKALEAGATIDQLIALPIGERIGRMKYVEENEIAKVFEEIEKLIESEMQKLTMKEVE